MTGIRSVLTSLAVAGAVALAGALPAKPVEAAELKKVSVRLAFGYNAHRSPYLLGVDKGFYKEAGLDVEVLEGKGVTYALQLVANGENTFAIVDPPSLMLGVASGMPLKHVLQLYQKSPNAAISWKDADVTSPKDMVGKTVATLQGDTTTTMLYALMARNGIDKDSVKVFASGGGTRNQTFLSKRAEIITGFSNDSYIGLMDKTGGEVQQFSYADFGIDTMGDGVVAHVDTLKNDPDAVRAFVQATVRSYEYALDHPEESAEALRRKADKEPLSVSIDKIKATRELVYTGISKQHGVGYNDRDAWKAAEDLMLEWGGLKKAATSVEEYYTNEFLQ